MATVLKIKSKKTAAAQTAQPGAKRTGAKVAIKGGKAKGEPTEGRMLGRTSGLSVMKYQNQSLEQNRKRKLSDEQLAKEWCAEFPNSRAVRNGRIDAAMVRSVRNTYNLGKHGNNDGNPIPNPVPEFDENGQALPFWGTRMAARREAKEAEAAKASKSKKAVAAPTKKVIKKGR